MSAVAARKAALAKLASASASSSALPSFVQSLAPTVEPIYSPPEVVPVPSTSRNGTPQSKKNKRVAPKGGVRASQKHEGTTERVVEKRYYEETAVRDSQGKGKRATRIYERPEEECVEDDNEGPAASGEISLSQSEDDEELDFPALDVLQTISSGRPKKKRRIST
jgi:hypothetical protein